jgi:hypothetical protein
MENIRYSVPNSFPRIRLKKKEKQKFHGYTETPCSVVKALLYIREHEIQNF